MILCGVHLRGTFLTGHGTSYDKCVGNTEIRNSPCKYKIRLNYLFHFDGSKYINVVNCSRACLVITTFGCHLHFKTSNYDDKLIN